MKSLVFSVCILAAACSKPSEKEVTVVRDCTGTYLRDNNIDYHVCNFEDLAAYTDGAEIKAAYEPIDECQQLDTMIVCMMYHKNEGLIKVTSTSK